MAEDEFAEGKITCGDGLIIDGCYSVLQADWTSVNQDWCID